MWHATVRVVGLERIRHRARRRRDPWVEPGSGYVEAVARHGLIAPLPVCQSNDGDFELLAGEREWVAARRAGLHEVPVAVHEMLDGVVRRALEHDVDAPDPIEEAERLRSRLQALGTGRGAIAALARQIGRSPSWLSHRLRLLQLPEPIRRAVSVGALTTGHGKALVGVDDPDRAARLALRTLEHSWSVRDLERAVSDGSEGHAGDERANGLADIARAERLLGGVLGAPVRVDPRAGTLTIDYFGDPELLDGLIERLSNTSERSFGCAPTADVRDGGSGAWSGRNVLYDLDDLQE